MLSNRDAELDDQVSLDERRSIDRLADAFELAFSEVRQPPLLDYLHRVGGRLRPLLYRELRLVQLECGRQHVFESEPPGWSATEVTWELAVKDQCSRAQSATCSEQIALLEDYAARFPQALDLQRVPLQAVLREVATFQSMQIPVQVDALVARFPHLAGQLGEEAFSVPSGDLETRSLSDRTARQDRQPGASADATHAGLLEPGSRFGQYRILAQIGKGGMGTVYQARHLHLGKLVALKILGADSSLRNEQLARFNREMQALASLDHPHIVRAMDAGEIQGIHYLAMEFLDGTDVRRRVEEQGVFSVSEACSLLAAAAEGLQAAHEAGLVHRDLKPANLLLDRRGELKIADLGLARWVEAVASESVVFSELTTDAHCVGTPGYMAPEQWEHSNHVDARADLYSLGCTLHFLLTGRAPFDRPQHATAAKKMCAHLSEAPPSLASRNGEAVPDWLEQLYKCLLAKDPNERPGSAHKVVEWLRQETAPGDAPSLESTLWFQEAGQLGNHRDQRHAPGRRAWLAIGAAITGLVCIAGMLNWRMGAGAHSREVGIAQHADAALFGPAVEDLVVEIYSEVSGGQQAVAHGQIGKQLAEASFGQLARLSANFSRPQFACLVALNPIDSKPEAIQLCLPQSSDSVPQLVNRIEFPQKPTDYFAFSDGVGQQVFLLIHSDASLPSAGQLRSSLEQVLEWGVIAEGGCWRFVGNELAPVVPSNGKDRGSIRRVEPPALDAALVAASDRLHKDGFQVTAIAFPVVQARP